MARIIKGADVAASLKEKLKTVIEADDIKPCLAVVQVGHDESNASYEKGIVKNCGAVGVTVKKYSFDENISQEDFIKEFLEINNDPAVHGILLFRPLPGQISEDAVAEIINPDKDVDCMSPANWAKLAMGDKNGYYPCTAEAVIKILDYANIELNGARAVVLGRSRVIGRPLGLMLLSRNATVTWCHSRTKNIPQMCTDAEILISACGVADMVGEEIACKIASGCAAVDVGINFVDGRMCGDFDFDAVCKHAGYVTPVPGGVGAVTSTIMVSHVVRAAFKLEKNIEVSI